MAAMEVVDVLQLADRPWQEISTVRLPAATPPQKPGDVDDAPGCDFSCLLKAGAPFSDVSVDGRPLHALFVDGAGDDVAAAYGAAGAASRAAARDKLLRATRGDVAARGDVAPPPGDCDLCYEGAAVRAHRCVLWAQSEYCRGALAHGSARVALPACGAALRAALPELGAYVATRDAREREALLDACGAAPQGAGEPAAVCVARFADAALLWDLKAAALARLLAAVDDGSAAPLLGVARSLDDEPLRRACLERVVAAGVDAARAAAGPELFDALIPVERHAALRRLGDLARSNPLSCRADLSDAREAVAMLREAVDDRGERLVEAEDRQREAERRCRRGRRGAADRENAAKVRAAIEKQRVSLASLERFTRTQEALFADAEDRARVDGDGDFLPSYEWRPVPEGAAVPPGLDVKLSFEGKQTIARIPEPWQLRLVKDDRFVRVAVDRHARVADVVAELGGGVVLVGDGGALDGDRRFDAKLWRARQRLKVRELT